VALLTPLQERIISLGLIGLGVYFTVQLARGLAGYLRFRRVRPTALVSWPVPRPAPLPWLVALSLGALGAVLALVNGWLGRPASHVYGLAVMAAYFLVMVPLATRIRLGLYRDGVWGDVGFLRWADVARIAFVERPQIVLVLLPRKGGGSLRLPVPPGEYGAVRKLLEEKARAGALRLDPAILGL
jgi:hypothetical protein